MKNLTKMHLVQYSFWDYETFNLRADGTAFIGPNGAGKTSLLDAIQIVLMGAHGSYTQFNAQSIYKDRRSVRDYALGMLRSADSDKGVVIRKRDEALSYISLVFEGDSPADCVSCGICIHAQATEKKHRVLGLYVLPGVRLQLEDHLGALDGGGMAPIEWQTFDALARKLAKDAARTPTITGKPEAYLDELFHALAPRGRSIDREKLVRSLMQSLRLKNVSGVDDYLRGYLVDAQPIDKQGTLKHIKSVRSLLKQIEEVGQQIANLEDIDRRFTVVSNLYRTRAVAKAVRLQLAMEATDERVSNLKGRVDTLQATIEGLKEAQRLKAEQSEELNNSYVRLLTQFNSDPASNSSVQAKQIASARAANLRSVRSNLDRLCLEVRDALAKLPADLEQAADLIAQLKVDSSQWQEVAKEGKYMDIHQLQTVLDRLRLVLPILEQRQSNAKIAKIDADKHLTATTQKIRVASQGVRLSRNDDIAIAISTLEEKQIPCQPIATLVSVTKPEWQGAIETLLGRNRFALVVEANRENEAVRLLRETRRPLYDVTIVQPWHLRDVVGRKPDTGTVAELIVGKSATALAFVHRVLGRMKRVETEDELRINDRALTKDGMLSANGGTRRLRLEQPDLWALGVQISELEKNQLRSDLLDYTDKVSQATDKLAESEDALTAVKDCLKAVTIATYESALSAFNSAATEHESANLAADIELPEYLAALSINVDVADKAAKAATAALQVMASKMATAVANVASDEKALREESTQLAELQEAYAIASSDQDYDAQIAAEKYSQLVNVAQDIAASLQQLATEESSAGERLMTAQATAHVDFRDYINRWSINLVDERSDWRLATLWTKRHLAKLKDSTLVEYQKEAEQAREAASRSFRADVAFRMREAILRMRLDIDDLNKILAICPEFTNSERYKFIAEPAEAHKAIYELILNSTAAESGELSLEQPGTTQDKLVQFLEDCEKGVTADNPLEDYRLLFKFDLGVFVGGVEVDRLSKRLGVASNGEHLVPFYVIAGACLANAYRIKTGELHDGFALMLTDEAFHGFDEQNTYVTAKFLSSLGLQCVFAAPDSDRGKLASVLGSMYDLFRSDSDVFIEEAVIKEPARRLMVSDMPMQNPDLVDRMIDKLTKST
jgi:chromosome segregation protein